MIQVEQLPVDRPWTTAELIAYLRLEHLKQPAKMISRWVKQGRLKAGRCGRSFRFTKQQADAFLNLK